MTEDRSNAASRGQWADGEAAAAGAPELRPTAALEPRNLVPLLVEQAGPEYGLVWVSASRSELVPGAVFPARGSLWVVTGPSPSGVTFLCREVAGEVHE